MDERYYEMVLTELRSIGPRRGLLAKAFAETGGDECAAEARYLKLRALQLLRNDQRTARRSRRRAIAVVATLALLVAAAAGTLTHLGI